MPKLRVMDHTGDSVLEWTKDKDEQEVRLEFDRLVAEGHLAYRINSPGDAEVIRSFDPGAEEIVLHRAIAGG